MSTDPSASLRRERSGERSGQALGQPMNNAGTWWLKGAWIELGIEGRVEAAEPPDLSEVLHRIDGLLYPTGQQDSVPNNQAEGRKL